MRAGWRLRWVGSPRFTVADLVAFVRGLLADDSSALFRSLHPDSVPLSQRMVIDQINISLMGTVIARKAAGDDKAEFEPLYRYPGDPWGEREQVLSGDDLVPGGLRVMKPDEAMAWFAEDFAAGQAA